MPIIIDITNLVFQPNNPKYDCLRCGGEFGGEPLKDGKMCLCPYCGYPYAWWKGQLMDPMQNKDHIDQLKEQGFFEQLEEIHHEEGRWG
jgi:DNA-directed RNA polymerase subunit RPC12/RpoP